MWGRGQSQEIVLGCEAKDIVTGFNGIVVGKLEFLNRCIQWSIKPRTTDKDGKPHEAAWFDVESLEYVGAGITAQLEKGRRPAPEGGRALTGGPDGNAAPMPQL